MSRTKVTVGSVPYWCENHHGLQKDHRENEYRDAVITIEDSGTHYIRDDSDARHLCLECAKTLIEDLANVVMEIEERGIDDDE